MAAKSLTLKTLDRALTQSRADNSAGGDEVITATFKALPFEALIVDTRGAILFANPSALERFGWTSLEERPENNRLSDAFTISTPDVAQAIRDGISLGNMLLSARGATTLRPRPTRFNCTQLPGPDGTRVRVLLVRDMQSESAAVIASLNHDRRFLEDQLADAQANNHDLTEALQKMKIFTSAASHDLRNPIAVLRGLVDHLNSGYRDGLPSEAGKVLDVMSRATDQMGELTTQLLDHARSTTGKIHAVPNDIHSVLGKVRENLRPLLLEAGGTLSVEGPSGALMADTSLLEVLCSNLVSNAIKYRSPERKLHITIRTLGNAVLQVTDNGIGFSDEQAAQMFQAFEQLDKNNARGGTGLGLATCNEICRRHGWTIRAEGTPRSGATFTVSFGADKPLP